MYNNNYQDEQFKSMKTKLNIWIKLNKAIKQIVKTIKEIKNWGPGLEIIHETLGPNYYKITSDRWQEGAGKENTADIVFITKGDAGGLSNALKADVDLVWNDKVKGKISTSDKTIEWFQVSLKKVIDSLPEYYDLKSHKYDISQSEYEKKLGY